jgi:hypothetical protein
MTCCAATTSSTSRCRTYPTGAESGRGPFAEGAALDCLQGDNGFARSGLLCLLPLIPCPPPRRVTMVNTGQLEARVSVLDEEFNEQATLEVGSHRPPSCSSACPAVAAHLCGSTARSGVPALHPLACLVVPLPPPPHAGA